MFCLVYLNGKNEMYRIMFKMLLVVHHEKSTHSMYSILNLVLWPNLSGQAIEGVLQPCRRVTLPSP